MGVLEFLTVVFIVLKLVGVIDWSWVQVFIPVYISIGIYLIWAIFIGSITSITFKYTNKYK